MVGAKTIPTFSLTESTSHGKLIIYYLLLLLYLSNVFIHVFCMLHCILPQVHFALKALLIKDDVVKRLNSPKGFPLLASSSI